MNKKKKISKPKIELTYLALHQEGNEEYSSIRINIEGILVNKNDTPNLLGLKINDLIEISKKERK